MLKNISTLKPKRKCRAVKSQRDARKLSKETLIELRTSAIFMNKNKNIGAEKIAELLKVSSKSVYNWLNIFKKTGIEGLAATDKRIYLTKISNEQKDEISELIIATLPTNHGFEVSLWTKKNHFATYIR